MSYLLNAEFKRQGLLGSPSANQNSDVAGRHSRLKRQRGRLWLCAWMVVTLVQGARAAEPSAARPLEQTQATGSTATEPAQSSVSLEALIERSTRVVQLQILVADDADKSQAHS